MASNDIRQKYHSLAVKGEKVRVDPQKPTEDLANGDTLPGIKSDPGAPATTSEARKEDQIHATTQPVLASAAGAAAVSIPQALLSTGKLSVPYIGLTRVANRIVVQNDDLKNLMMSWYYAGYYTGLYEGKQQGYASAMERSEG